MISASPWRLLTVCAVLGVLVPTSVSAEPLLTSRPPGERAPRLSDFWRRSPGQQRARAKQFSIAMAQLRAGIARGSQQRVVSAIAVQLAQSSFRELALENPRSARTWYWYGYTALLLGQNERAITAYRQVWNLDPSFWGTPGMAFELGILLAKLGRYRESVEVYDRGIPAESFLRMRGLMSSNCAESVMALGKLRRAIGLYQQSLRLRTTGNDAAWWGLMVAYDRLGHAQSSRRAARQALLMDPTLRGLVGTGVFFVPRGDVHYYLGLAYEEQGRMGEAARQWQRFLVARPRSRWAKRAKEHLSRLQHAMGAWRPRVSLTLVHPAAARNAVALLTPHVEHCYRLRARRRPVPEGLVMLVLIRRKQRIISSTSRWNLGTLRDPQLKRCIRRSLQNRKLPGVRHARIRAMFRMELSP